jgi:hypothetical protein
MLSCFALIRYRVYSLDYVPSFVDFLLHFVSAQAALPPSKAASHPLSETAEPQLHSKCHFVSLTGTVLDQVSVVVR